MRQRSSRSLTCSYIVMLCMCHVRQRHAVSEDDDLLLLLLCTVYYSSIELL